MAKEEMHGAMIVIAGKVYFISREDLRSYLLPDDAAKQALSQIAEHRDELKELTKGPDAGKLIGVKYTIGPKPNETTLGFSSLIMHALTCPPA